ncbi:uncharacterized protein LOC115451937 [Manduca sexta]|uniref:uncharacterized protein LOC115451937 n=1 Tax=Manduca sexta TaxID=7130 RepID=UPI00188F1C68|nr:uncharacterized protein LOC115451937 [Manduca sexta]
MTSKCAFKNCKNGASNAVKNDGVVYFRFPRDPFRCAEWVSVVAQQRCQEIYTPNDSSVVCSEHFAEKDMYDSDKGLKLHTTAVPCFTDDTPEIYEIEEAESSTESNDLEVPDVGPSTHDKYKKSHKEVQNQSKPSKKNKSRAGSRLKGNKNDSAQNSIGRYTKMLSDRNEIIHHLRKRNARLTKQNKNLKEALRESRRRIELDTIIGKNICKSLFLQYMRKYGHLYRKVEAGAGNSG